MASRQKGMTARIGPMQLDVPRTGGYYLGVGAAVAFGVIDWPVAIFIGAIPVVKMMQSRRLPASVQFAVHLFDGASQPVGGDAEGTVQLDRMPEQVTRAVSAVRRTLSSIPIGSSRQPRRTARRAARSTAAKAPVARRSAAAAPARKARATSRKRTATSTSTARPRATARPGGPSTAAGDSPLAADTASS